MLNAASRFRTHGSDGFLALEESICAQLDVNNSVIATGGSVVYEQYAHITVDCGGQDIEHTLRRVRRALEKQGNVTK